MPKQLAYLFVGFTAFGLIAVALFTQQPNRHVAQNKPNPASAALPAAAKSAQPAAQSAESATVSANPTAVNPAITEIEKIQQTVADLVAKEEAALLGQTGWLHVAVQPLLSQASPDDTVTVDVSGQQVARETLVPEQAQFQSWYHVDAAGGYEEGLTLVTSPNGQIHQQAVLLNNQWVNLTLPTTETAFASSNATLNPALPSQTIAHTIAQMADWSTVQWRASQEGSVYTIVAEQPFADPIFDTRLQQAVLASRQTFAFDSERGHLLQTAVAVQLSDGSWLLQEQWQYAIPQFSPELPAETAVLLAQAQQQAAK